MFITQTHGFPVYEPINDNELSNWRPAISEPLQFVKISRREYWIFHCGDFLGSATKLIATEAWQAVSDGHRFCVAPLASLLECAERLMSVEHTGDEK